MRLPLAVVAALAVSACNFNPFEYDVDVVPEIIDIEIPPTFDIEKDGSHILVRLKVRGCGTAPKLILDTSVNYENRISGIDHTVIYKVTLRQHHRMFTRNQYDCLTDEYVPAYHPVWAPGATITFTNESGSVVKTVKVNEVASEPFQASPSPSPSAK